MVKSRRRKTTFAPKEFKPAKISMKLFRIIKNIQKEMQMIENTKKGKRASTISFILASDELAKRLKQ